jgi:putative membrane protein insertion efficiency factor
LRRYAKFAALQFLRAYKWAISPMLPPSCRFVPTCSEYAMEAIDRYGLLRGTFMALMRLLRCHPLARRGYDPVVGDARGEDEKLMTGDAVSYRRAEGRT